MGSVKIGGFVMVWSCCEQRVVMGTWRWVVFGYEGFVFS